MLNSLVAEIVSRFGIVVSDRLAASALPVVGAVGGATVNVIFMNHFQQIAQGHFTVRRLEREYGAETVRLHYAELAARRPRTANAGGRQRQSWHQSQSTPAVRAGRSSRRVRASSTCGACARSRPCCWWS